MDKKKQSIRVVSNRGFTTIVRTVYEVETMPATSGFLFRGVIRWLGQDFPVVYPKNQAGIYWKIDK